MSEAEDDACGGHGKDAGGLWILRRPRLPSRAATPTSPSTTSSGPCGQTTRWSLPLRRLLTIGVLASQDKPELLELQFDSALDAAS